MKNFLLITCLLLAACLPKENKSIDIDNMKIVEGELGGQKYYVPEAYFNPLGDGFAADDIALQVYYPTFSPLPETTKEMWKKGKLGKKIAILVNHMPKPKTDFHNFTVEMTKMWGATELVGQEYGLIHKTQRNDLKIPSLWQLDDVWYEEEDGKYVSYITCSEKYSKVSVEVCTHRFRLQPSLSIRIDFEKKILPNWKAIKSDFIAMFESFKSPETAKEFLIAHVNQSNAKH